MEAWKLAAGLALGIAASSAGTDAPQSFKQIPGYGPVETDLAGLLEDYSAAPVNGVGLTIQVTPHPAEAPTVLNIAWEMDYTGPRQPFTVLKPSLTVGSAPYETFVSFYAKGKSGKIYSYTFNNPVRFPRSIPTGPDENDFVTVPRGKTAKGVIPVRIKDVKQNFVWRRPDEFRSGPISTIHVDVRFRPQDRGEGHGLDAWTGEVFSNIAPSELRRW